MFKNLFKKEAVLNKEAIMADLPKGISKTIYPKEVLEIHHEFETAADRLFDEAQIIIKEAESKDIQKVSRLEKLGFTSSSQVTNIKPLLKKAELSKEQIELISYYKKNYPNNKFITEDQVKEICHKYNLICGDVNRFKGFVPEKNLREIEAFELKKKELNTLVIKAFDSRGNNIGIFSAENIEIKQHGGYYHMYLKDSSDKSKYSFQQSDFDLVKNGEFYGTDYENFFGLQGKKGLRIQVLNKKLQICAPIKDMDISDLELKEGYKLEKKHTPDPVVLQPVKHGYLILTAWGDEQDDPIVKND